LVAVHGTGAAEDLRRIIPGMDDQIVAVRLGEGEILTPEREAEARKRIRGRYGIADDAVVFGCFGGLTPEKRIAHVFDALPAAFAAAPSVRLLLAGAPAAHYDVQGEIETRGLQDRVTMTGYLDSDAELTDHLAACDVSINLRWPTARETSGPWLRALAAGRPTIVTDLVHMGDVPSLDPRTWRANAIADLGPRAADPICVAIDILDEDHSLRLAMRRLAADADLRRRLGSAARDWWQREHSVEAMTDDYVRVMNIARTRPALADPDTADAATGRLRTLAAPFGVTAALSHDGFLE
jgi:glycosyltransferase involved in cell wall biosynthesis